MADIMDTHLHLISPEPNSGCWLWEGSCRKDRYGRLSYGLVTIRKSTYPHTYKSDIWMAHRWSWTITKGPIPAGLQVLHSCDVHQCVNPDHLFLGTHDDNMKDKVAKGRQSRPRGEMQSQSKLTREQVLAIRADPRRQWEIAKDFGVGRRYVSFIKARQRWAWL